MVDSRVLQALSELLRDTEASERELALNRLGALAPPGATDLALPLLDDDDESVGIAAMVCLGDIRDVAGIPHLVRVVEKAANDPSVKYAVIAMAQFTDSAVRDCLLRMLAGGLTSNVARPWAVMQLWRYLDDEVIDALKEAALHDDDRNVRSHAADSLALLFRALQWPADWAPFWERVAEDEEIGVSRFGEKALRPLSRR